MKNKKRTVRDQISMVYVATLPYRRRSRRSRWPLKKKQKCVQLTNKSAFTYSKANWKTKTHRWIFFIIIY